jgi:hypothetical protein
MNAPDTVRPAAAAAASGPRKSDLLAGEISTTDSPPKQVGQLEFDWNDANADLVVQHAVEPVAIYLNNNGDLIIRERCTGYDGDAIIIIARGNVLAVIHHIEELLAADQEADPPKREPKDRTAAERQRRHRDKRDSERDKRDSHDDERDSVTPFLRAAEWWHGSNA